MFVYHNHTALAFRQPQLGSLIIQFPVQIYNLSDMPSWVASLQYPNCLGFQAIWTQTL